MKNLLIYQSTEYDCGPTTLTNAIRYLFDREEIYPDIVKYIMLYCLDSIFYLKKMSYYPKTAVLSVPCSRMVLFCSVST